MLLYKFVPTEAIARQVSNGVFRFYELTKYRKIEDESGRADLSEGSITFPDAEVNDAITSLPVASFNGIEFSCSGISLSDDHLRQYFVFCMSIDNSEIAIDGCNYMVELDTDIFDTFEILLPTPQMSGAQEDGLKFFSHSPINYYDINNHPPSIDKEWWKEVYSKHSNFAYQKEYRAALFVSDFFFDRVGKTPATFARPIVDDDGNRFPFDLKLIVASGTDENGWRYLELDVSECKVLLVARHSSDHCSFSLSAS